MARNTSENDDDDSCNTREPLHLPVVDSSVIDSSSDIVANSLTSLWTTFNDDDDLHHFLIYFISCLFVVFKTSFCLGLLGPEVWCLMVFLFNIAKNTSRPKLFSFDRCFGLISLYNAGWIVIFGVLEYLWYFVFIFYCSKICNN